VSERFQAVVEGRPHGTIAVRVPFDPSTAWGEKERHYVTGSIDGRSLRGRLTSSHDTYFLQLGPAWNCNQFAAGDRVSVDLEPEGPQLATLAPDFATALDAEPAAREFFESLATFYRTGYVRWVESAKRPETRDRRIREAVAALGARRQQR
jgi:hypothetical protein